MFYAVACFQRRIPGKGMLRYGSPVRQASQPCLNIHILATHKHNFSLMVMLEVKLKNGHSSTISPCGSNIFVF